MPLDLHSSDERQHQIADTLSKLATEELKRAASAKDSQAAARRSDATGTNPETSLSKIIGKSQQIGLDL